MKAIVSYEIHKFKANQPTEVASDLVIVEEPLEINIQKQIGQKKSEPFIVTMRTPGHDHELCVGILFSHAIIHKKKDISFFKFLIADSQKTQVLIGLNNNETLAVKKGYTNSSCGICNAETWEDVIQHSNYPILDKELRIPQNAINACFALISNTEDHFSKTGGNHKICIVDFSGQVLMTAEDVGRHNAFDKVLGTALLADVLPLSNTIAILSGRCSFEMCQKAWLAGIPVIASLGAPSSKAIEMADNAGITLIGFLKKDSFNVYTHHYRLC